MAKVAPVSKKPGELALICPSCLCRISLAMGKAESVSVCGFLDCIVGGDERLKDLLPVIKLDSAAVVAELHLQAVLSIHGFKPHHPLSGFSFLSASIEFAIRFERIDSRSILSNLISQVLLLLDVFCFYFRHAGCRPKSTGNHVPHVFQPELVCSPAFSSGNRDM